MSTPFLGQISLFSFPFAPKRFALCNGQLLPISQNQALFALLGTVYGGDGVQTFALPDLRSRTPVHSGNGFTLGQRAGEENHTLTIPEMPSHNHTAAGNSDTSVATPDPANSVWGNSSKGAYASTADSTMSPAAIALAGGSQPHNNMSPYLVINFCIALSGIFPSRN